MYADVVNALPRLRFKHHPRHLRFRPVQLQFPVAWHPFIAGSPCQHLAGASEFEQVPRNPIYVHPELASARSLQRHCHSYGGVAKWCLRLATGHSWSVHYGIIRTAFVKKKRKNQESTQIRSALAPTFGWSFGGGERGEEGSYSV